MKIKWVQFFLVPALLLAVSPSFGATATPTTTPSPVPGPFISKSASSSVAAQGGNLTYSLNWAYNSGPDQNSFEVIDTLPAAAQFSSYSIPSGVSPTSFSKSGGGFGNPTVLVWDWVGTGIVPAGSAGQINVATATDGALLSNFFNQASAYAQNPSYGAYTSNVVFVQFTSATPTLTPMGGSSMTPTLTQTPGGPATSMTMSFTQTPGGLASATQTQTSLVPPLSQTLTPTPTMTQTQTPGGPVFSATTSPTTGLTQSTTETPGGPVSSTTATMTQTPGGPPTSTTMTQTQTPLVSLLSRTPTQTLTPTYAPVLELTPSYGIPPGDNPRDPGHHGSICYPNPIRRGPGHFVFWMPGAGRSHIRIYLATGAQAGGYTQEHSDGGLKVVILSLDGYARGVYFYVVDRHGASGLTDTTSLQKFIITR